MVQKFANLDSCIYLTFSLYFPRRQIQISKHLHWVSLKLLFEPMRVEDCNVASTLMKLWPMDNSQLKLWEGRCDPRAHICRGKEPPSRVFDGN